MMNNTNQVASIAAKPTHVIWTRSKAYKVGIATAKLAFSTIAGRSVFAHGQRFISVPNSFDFPVGPPRESV